MAILYPLLGGGLIGVAASILLVKSHETAGISGILEGFLRPAPGGRGWRGAFLVGLLAGGLALAVLAPSTLAQTPRPLVVAALGGVLVGFGTRLGGGCTSGHGVCGISRLSLPSIAATATFMGIGIATVLLYRMAGGGSP